MNAWMIIHAPGTQNGWDLRVLNGQFYANTFQVITLLSFELQTPRLDQHDQRDETNLVVTSRATPEKYGCDMDGSKTDTYFLWCSIHAPSQVSRNGWMHIQAFTLHFTPGLRLVRTSVAFPVLEFISAEIACGSVL